MDDNKSEKVLKIPAKSFAIFVRKAKHLSSYKSLRQGNGCKMHGKSKN